ncbi:MAG: 50S ribosomal protein L23 [bacterium]|nr:50S ribosomal protein L23 [bacterium]
MAATKKIEKKPGKMSERAFAASMAVLRQPRVTEKAAMKGSDNVYVFEVSVTADKKAIARAVEAVFNVVPARVHVVPIPAKKIFARGKQGTRGGGKKAYVYLKDGDKIELI